jgi:hypothetical protein
VSWYLSFAREREREKKKKKQKNDEKKKKVFVCLVGGFAVFGFCASGRSDLDSKSGFVEKRLGGGLREEDAQEIVFHLRSVASLISVSWWWWWGGRASWWGFREC